LASSLQDAAAAGAGPDGLPEGEQTNEAASALMEKALAAREQKRKETEDARKKADLASGGAMKKGFLNSSKAKKRTSKDAEPAKETEDIPFISGAADPEAAKRESLKLPEVQKLIQDNTRKLKEDQSWVTPQLMQALASRPDLSKAMSDPKIQEAMQLMQTDPEGAKQRFKDDPDVTKFMKDFTGLMATHFDVLANQAEAPKAAAPPAPPSQKAIDAPLSGLDLAAKPPAAALAPPSSGGETRKGEKPLPTEDPKIMALLQDPEVMALIAGIRAGKPFELHEVGRRNPRLFQKVRVLIENGLLAMQH
jgi:hypothetical protein